MSVIIVEIYVAHLRMPQTSGIHILMQAAACRHMVGDIKEAAEVYEHSK